MTAVRRALALVVAALTLTVAVPAALADPPLPSADPFYSYSAARLSNGRRAPILRQRTIPNADLGTSTPISATQVLFRTSKRAGTAAATVATIISPASGAPPGRNADRLLPDRVRRAGPRVRPVLHAAGRQLGL